MTEEEIARAGGDWVRRAARAGVQAGIALKVDGIRAIEAADRPGDRDRSRRAPQSARSPSDTVLRPMKKTWVDSLVFLLNRRDVTVLLFFMMILAWYFEAVTGTGAFAILARSSAWPSFSGAASWEGRRTCWSWCCSWPGAGFLLTRDLCDTRIRVLSPAHLAHAGGGHHGQPDLLGRSIPSGTLSLPPRPSRPLGER